MASPINYIIYSDKEPITAVYKEMANQVESCEFLRRRYCYVGATGQSEIIERIKLLASNNIIIKIVILK